MAGATVNGQTGGGASSAAETPCTDNMLHVSTWPTV